MPPTDPPADPSADPPADPAVPVLIPTLTDEVVTLRPLGMDDLDAVVEQSRDPETVRWTFVPDPYGLQEGRDFIALSLAEWQDDLGCGWAIEHDGRFAGLVSYQSRGGGAVEVAFAAHPAARGRGVMTRAVRLAVAHAFDHGADIVLWHARVGNVGSRKVAWRCGFTLGGPTVATRHDHVMEVWSGHLRRGEPMQPSGRWLEVPHLEAGGIRLRAFREDDAAQLPDEVDAVSASFGEKIPTRGDFPRWVLERHTQMASGRAFGAAVVDAETDLLLGGVHLSRLDVRLFRGTAMLGYWLVERARGRGVTAQALEVLLPWAFRPEPEGGLGLHRISAGCAAGNAASARVLRRAGFALVGVERGALWVQGTPTDALLFDLLGSDDRDAQRVQPRPLPFIETRRFRLRPWRPDDVPTPEEGPDDDSLWFMPPFAHPSRETYAAWLARRVRIGDSGVGLDWCVADRETDHALGTVTIFHLDPSADGFQAELGYWLHPTARGRGVLREVLPVVVDHAFRPAAEGGLGLTRLHAGTVAENAASRAILQGVGFRPWGNDRQAWRNANGELTDGAYFELLASDPRPDRTHVVVGSDGNRRPKQRKA